MKLPNGTECTVEEYASLNAQGLLKSISGGKKGAAKKEGAWNGAPMEAEPKVTIYVDPATKEQAFVFKGSQFKKKVLSVNDFIAASKLAEIEGDVITAKPNIRTSTNKHTGTVFVYPNGEHSTGVGLNLLKWGNAYLKEQKQQQEELIEAE